MFLFTAMPVLTTAYAPLILLQWFTLTCYISFSVHKYLKRYYFFYENLFTSWLIQPPSHLMIYLVLWYDYIILPNADLYQYFFCILFLYHLSLFFFCCSPRLIAITHIIVYRSVFKMCSFIVLTPITTDSIYVYMPMTEWTFRYFFFWLLFSYSGQPKATLAFNWQNKLVLAELDTHLSQWFLKILVL